MRVLNFGSLNLDYVYAVDHFVQPGETIRAASRRIMFGGKGLNQSVALARAGARVFHAGCIGAGGEALRKMLAENGVDVSGIRETGEVQGHTVIQVNPDGQNSIILCPGSNERVTEEQIRETLDGFGAGDWLVLQNEISGIPALVETAYAKGMRIVLNPSPFNEKLKNVDFSKISWLLVNEVEAEQLTGSSDPDMAWSVIHARWPKLSALITLGENGSAAYAVKDGETEKAVQGAVRVRAVDTTAAGDTYTGYFIAGLTENRPLKQCMERASAAAAVSVTRPGAADSIPRACELRTTDEGLKQPGE